MGASWASVADYGIAALLNIFFVYRFTGYGLAWSDVWRPLAASLAMAATVIPTYYFSLGQLNSNSLATLVAIALGGIVYVVVILLTGGVRSQDIRKLPKIGNFMANRLENMKIVKKS